MGSGEGVLEHTTCGIAGVLEAGCSWMEAGWARCIAAMTTLGERLA